MTWPRSPSSPAGLLAAEGAARARPGNPRPGGPERTRRPQCPPLACGAGAWRAGEARGVDALGPEEGPRGRRGAFPTRDPPGSPGGRAEEGPGCGAASCLPRKKKKKKRKKISFNDLLGDATDLAHLP